MDKPCILATVRGTNKYAGPVRVCYIRFRKIICVKYHSVSSSPPCPAYSPLEIVLYSPIAVLLGPVANYYLQYQLRGFELGWILLP